MQCPEGFASSVLGSQKLIKTSQNSDTPYHSCGISIQLEICKYTYLLRALKKKNRLGTPKLINSNYYVYHTPMPKKYIRKQPKIAISRLIYGKGGWINEYNFVNKE